MLNSITIITLKSEVNNIKSNKKKEKKKKF